MELHNLKPSDGSKKNRKRVGRGIGSGNGKTAGRGHKGSQSRSGHYYRAGFEGGQMPLHRRLPKRGFHHAKRNPMAIVNIDVLEKVFESGAEITMESVAAHGLVSAMPGGLKVLARGEVKKKFSVKVNAISPAAKVKIEAAGGTVELIGAVAPQGE
jgi:large subunit ribosomal protein L15